LLTVCAETSLLMTREWQKNAFEQSGITVLWLGSCPLVSISVRGWCGGCAFGNVHTLNS
jgi:hypothetical protein